MLLKYAVFFMKFIYFLFLWWWHTRSLPLIIDADSDKIPFDDDDNDDEEDKLLFILSPHRFVLNPKCQTEPRHRRRPRPRATNLQNFYQSRPTATGQGLLQTLQPPPSTPAPTSTQTPTPAPTSTPTSSPPLPSCTNHARAINSLA